MTGRALCLEHAVQTFGSLTEAPGQPWIWLMDGGRHAPVMREPQEIQDEEYEQVVGRVAA